jgi:cytochrome P450
VRTLLCAVAWPTNVLGRIAGVDTSSTTLAYAFWELSRRRDVLVRLQEEIDDVMPDARVVPDVAVLHRCAYLGAFIKESACLLLSFFVRVASRR